MTYTATLPVAILAGGLATRLRPVTERIPKALVPVAGEPFLAHQLRLLASHGIQRAVLCIGYLGNMIERTFGTHFAGIDLDYSLDGETLLGTGGALRRALPLLGDAFFVLYGDSYLPIDYRAVQRAWEKSGQPALMTVFENDGAWDTSNVEFAAGRILHYDKRHKTPAMRHIDYGLSIFRAENIATLPTDTPSDLAEIQHHLAEQGRLAAFEATHRFYEIGTPTGLAELDTLLSTTPAPRA